MPTHPTKFAGRLNVGPGSAYFALPRVVSVLAAMLSAGAASAQVVQVPGVGTEGQGADLVVLDLDPGGSDMILMAYDNPPGGNSFRYRVGRNLNSNGIATAGWSAPIILPGLGSDGQGAGIAAAQLDNNPMPELILMAYNSPPGPNSFYYMVGRNLNAGGMPTTGWSAPIVVPGLGWEGQGAAATVGRINSNPRPDLVFVAYDNPAGGNNFRYTIGWDLNAAGVATSWTSVYGIPGLGWEGQGAGAALFNLDTNPRPELVLMAYDHPAGGNNFRYTIGWNLNAAGIATSWTTAPQLPGLGWEGQGAGLAITCLDSAVNARGDWIFMAYDNPPGANSFRYYVVKNLLGAPTCGIP